MCAKFLDKNETWIKCTQKFLSSINKATRERFVFDLQMWVEGLVVYGWIRKSQKNH